MEKVFMYEGREFSKLKEIAEYRGVKQVSRRDFERLGITEVEKSEQPTVVESKEEKAAEVTENQQTEAKTSNNVETKTDKEKSEPSPEPKEELKPEPPVEPENDEKADAEPSTKEESKKVEPEIVAEESDGKQEFSEEVLNDASKLQKEMGYANIDELAADLKRRKAEDVIGLAKSLGLTWKEDSHAGINRMRAAMEIRKKVFPGERRTRAPKSGWKKVPYEVMVGLAKDNNLEFRETADEKINRMWVIKALKDANIQPPVQEEEQK